MIEGFVKAIEGMFGANIEGTTALESVGDVSEGISINEGYGIDSEINSDLSNQITSEGVENIKENYENVDKVLENIKQELGECNNEVDFQRQMKRIETYKGTVFENMCKESLSDKFGSIEQTQKTIETSEGYTKPDIILNDANEDFSIGNVEVKQGEDLFVEVKCGSSNYIESEMKHIENQVLGHSEGKSLVIVTKDYLDIDPQREPHLK